MNNKMINLPEKQHSIWQAEYLLCLSELNLMKFQP